MITSNIHIAVLEAIYRILLQMRTYLARSNKILNTNYEQITMKLQIQTNNYNFRSSEENIPNDFPFRSATSYELVPFFLKMVHGTY